MSILYGAFGAIAVLTLLALGFFAGWAAHGRFCRSRAERPEEAELRRLREEQDAFHRLQNYNADVAYGLAEEDDVS